MVRQRQPPRLDPDRRKIPSGLEGTNIPDDFTIPACGIEDVDRALFQLFDKDIIFETERGGNDPEKVPVIFATGERFALVKKRRALRDNNGILILPLISIRRTGIEQEFAGRGIAQDVGDIVIKRRLSDRDRAYQNLVNKLGLTNQSNVATKTNLADIDAETGNNPGTLASRRPSALSGVRSSKELLDSNLANNIFEVITIPFPHFYRATYEITFWTQYTQHMNQMLERLMSSYDAQGNQFRINTDKGYWFVAYVDEAVNATDNFDDFSEQERIIRYTFNLNVPAYFVGNKNPGDMVPFRRFLSAPQISFEILETSGQVTQEPEGSGTGTGDVDKFTLSDAELINQSGQQVLSNRLKPFLQAQIFEDPFTGEKSVKYVRVTNRNQRKGETTVKVIDTIGPL